jgi:hypothetical protein
VEKKYQGGKTFDGDGDDDDDDDDDDYMYFNRLKPSDYFMCHRV